MKNRRLGDGLRPRARLKTALQVLIAHAPVHSTTLSDQAPENFFGVEHWRNTVWRH